MRWTHFAAILCCSLCSAVIGAFAALHYLTPAGTAAPAPPINPERSELRALTPSSPAPTDFVRAVDRCLPSVVSVRALGSGESSSGSGVVFSADGYIATNYHVVAGAEEIRITLGDKREHPARLVGKDPATDLALLRISAAGLRPATFGNSDSLRIGEWVMAIGNPLRLSSTVTAGIVSAKGRSIDVLEAEDRIESFIQSDVAVNPGSSGGALVNTDGELIGINTAILSNSGRYEGYTFAVPGNLALRVLNDLRDFGRVKRAVLGAYVQEVNDARARRFGLPSARGAVITDITPTGSAYLGGLEVGDVLTEINGVAINSRADMQEQLSRYRPGQRVRVTYVRHERTRKLTLLLRGKEEAGRSLVNLRENERLQELGIGVRRLSPTEWDRHPTGGVRITSVERDGPAAVANVLAGLRVTAVDGRRIHTLDQFLHAIRGGGSLKLRGTYEDYRGTYDYELHPGSP
jgi:Do/DeqQ family serine protease